MHTTTPQELIDDFSYLDDWEARYAYLLDLGKELPPFPEHCRDEAHKVQGCVSQVWICGGKNAENKLELYGDSDAALVKGLVAVVLKLVNGRTAPEVQQMDIQNIFSQIGLQEHLSPNRRNGFVAMVERVKSLAAA